MKIKQKKKENDIPTTYNTKSKPYYLQITNVKTKLNFFSVKLIYLCKHV